MKPNLNLHLLAGLSLFSLSLPADASAAPRLPALFGDHMAIQADRPTPCWGWSQPGAGIDIVFKDDTSSRTIDTHASADASGRWQTTLPALPSGSRGTLRFTDPSGQTIVRDVIAAEVWLASGQSNMTRQIGTPDFPAQVAQTARTEAAGTGGGIRFFSVPQEGADEPTDDVHGKWIVVTPESVAKCSAVAWNFALSLHDELKSPVGMIVSAYGGTPVESWLPREALDSTPEAASVWKRNDERLAPYLQEMKAYDKALETWKQHGQPAGSMPAKPNPAPLREAPVRLYNQMIHGLIPYAAQGIIWYQGEQNSGRPAEYPDLIRALVTSWRKLWGAELPFYYVELANVHAPQTKPSEGGWALIREAQSAVLTLPGTGVATAIDVSDGTIHPWNKKPVGQRLAALALHDVYGRPGDPRSPCYASCDIAGDKVRLSFLHATGLRVRGGGDLRGFAIRGGDGAWHWAQSRIVGDRIEVWSPDVPAPAAVRYGWASNPVLSIENQNGLPLLPFRTDPESP
ncbi:MAG TPA: sialate O-acetylesterase [Rariglobus sp.]